MVVTLIMRYAEHGIALSRRQVKEAIEIIIARMPPARRLVLQFRNGTPGHCFLRSFARRHRHQVRFARPVRQGHARCQACHGDALTTHFATLEKIISKYNIDAARIWNCDETGATPGRDANGKAHNEAGGRDAKVGNFVNTSHVTMLPSGSADGDQIPPMFIFKGRRLSSRVEIIGGKRIVETYNDCLSLGSVINMREQGEE